MLAVHEGGTVSIQMPAAPCEAARHALCLAPVNNIIWAMLGTPRQHLRLPQHASWTIIIAHSGAMHVLACSRALISIESNLEQTIRVKYGTSMHGTWQQAGRVMRGSVVAQRLICSGQARDGGPLTFPESQMAVGAYGHQRFVLLLEKQDLKVTRVSAHVHSFAGMGRLQHTAAPRESDIRVSLETRMSCLVCLYVSPASHACILRRLVAFRHTFMQDDECAI
jgi:hypothetical protein